MTELGCAFENVSPVANTSVIEDKNANIQYIDQMRTPRGVFVCGDKNLIQV